MAITLLDFAAIDRRLVIDCRLLFLRDFVQMVRIGVHDFERASAQRVLFDVALCVDLAHANASRDDIHDTLDYDFIRDVIGNMIGNSHHELQETLCDGIVKALIRTEGVRAVSVSTRKPDVYPDAESVGVQRVAFKGWEVR